MILSQKPGCHDRVAVPDSRFLVGSGFEIYGRILIQFFCLNLEISAHVRNNLCYLSLNLVIYKKRWHDYQTDKSCNKIEVHLTYIY